MPNLSTSSQVPAGQDALGNTVATGVAVEDDTAAILEAVLSPAALGDELGWLAHYKVLKVLGRGAMGLVLQAEDSQLRRLVALKVMLPSLAANPQARERFLREARAVAALRDEHVVLIYQVGQERDIPYIAMEFLRGQSLEDRLQSGPPLSLKEVTRIGRELATGLAAAHAAGLVHRDIKPANIWLEMRDEGPGARGEPLLAPHPSALASRPSALAPRVKILDFGLVRPAQDQLHLTGSGLIVGTPFFMSPEQARGQGVDARSDLFSLGVVLYHLAAGRLPFDGGSLMALLTSLAVDTPQPLRACNPQVPAALEELVGRLLEKDPAKRPASALEVAAALHTIEAELPVSDATGPASTIHNLPSPLPTQVTPKPATTQDQPGKGSSGRLALGGIVAAALVLLALYLTNGRNSQPSLTGPPVLIGVLSSRTGTMAISERPVIDAVLMAVDEINRQGGVLGRPVQAVIADGQSDEHVFARQAEKLISEDKVCTVFGCWTSASRKAVKPVFEKHDHLLMYPVQYEGMEQSPAIVYGGPVPNQQILPALKWTVGFLNKKRWFLVGSDYVFPRAAHEVIKDQARELGCEIVGEEYLLLGSGEVGSVVDKIAQRQPDLILNTLNGDSNVAFFRALRRAKITPQRIPTLSFSISEIELSSMPGKDIAGDYVASSYFQGLDLEQNREFVRAFRARYGEQRGLSDAVETAYWNVHAWAQAVKRANSTEPPAIRAALGGCQLRTPQGPIQIDSNNQHTAQHARIGCFQLRDDGTAFLSEVYLSPQPVAPEPFPASRPVHAWQSFLHRLQQQWGGQWANPG